MSVSAVSSRPASVPQSQPAEYTVQRGDTLSGIAARHGVSLAALEAANPQIKNPNLIYPGQSIRIPSAGGKMHTGPVRAPVTPGGSNSQPGSVHTLAAGSGHAPSGMSISESGVKLIEGFEGLRLTAYQDAGGVWTIGYGHTGGVHAGEHISQAQAEAYLKSDLGWAQNAVRRNVHVPLTQNQFDALTSLTYNLGAGGYSGLLHDLNAGNYAKAQQDFHLYVHAGGRVLQGLVNRRNKEAALFGSKAPGGSTNPPPPSKPAPTGGSTYTVRSGDTLSSIAAHHGVSLAALEHANPQIKNPNRIYVGEKVHIPGKGGSAPSKPKPAPATTYTVRSGDTLSSIASHHGVSLSALEHANPQIKNPNKIYVGETIHIPGKGGSTPPKSTPKPATHNYTVRRGDSMSSIASHNGVSLAALERANPQIHNPNVIYPGEVVHIPGSGPVHAPSPVGPVKGTNAAAIAKHYYGEFETQLQRDGVTLNCPTSESCANFVTAMLIKSGKVSPHGMSYVQRVNVHSMSSYLKAHGWHVVPKSQAKPGDVWVCDGAHGESHTELVSSNNGGKVTLIGSNNHPVSSNQQINYDSYSATIGGSYILAPP